MTETAIISLSPEDAAEYPRPGMVVPGVMTFSPDDRWITYLYSPDNSSVPAIFMHITYKLPNTAAFILQRRGRNRGNTKRRGKTAPRTGAQPGSGRNALCMDARCAPGHHPDYDPAKRQCVCPG